jgi:hypothetical protein
MVLKILSRGNKCQAVKKASSWATPQPVSLVSSPFPLAQDDSKNQPKII